MGPLDLMGPSRVDALLQLLISPLLIFLPTFSLFYCSPLAFTPCSLNPLSLPPPPTLSTPSPLSPLTVTPYSPPYSLPLSPYSLLVLPFSPIFLTTFSLYPLLLSTPHPLISLSLPLLIIVLFLYPPPTLSPSLYSHSPYFYLVASFCS